MATTTKEDDRTAKFAAVLKGGSPAAQAPPPRRKRWIPRWLVTLFMLVGVGGAATLAVSRSGILASGTGPKNLLTEKVRRGDLVVSIVEDGNVESSRNKDIKCAVKNGSVILWIIKDGTEVEQGDELVILESAAIEDQISAQKIILER